MRGVTTDELDRVAHEFIVEHGAGLRASGGVSDFRLQGIFGFSVQGFGV